MYLICFPLLAHLIYYRLWVLQVIFWSSSFRMMQRNLTKVPRIATQYDVYAKRMQDVFLLLPLRRYHSRAWSELPLLWTIFHFVKEIYNDKLNYTSSHQIFKCQCRMISGSSFSKIPHSSCLLSLFWSWMCIIRFLSQKSKWQRVAYKYK